MDCFSENGSDDGSENAAHFSDDWMNFDQSGVVAHEPNGAEAIGNRGDRSEENKKAVALEESRKVALPRGGDMVEVITNELSHGGVF